MIRPFEQRKREKKEFKDQPTWTIITALDSILEQAEGSQLSDEFWETVKNPLEYLRQQLGITNIQIVVLAMMIEAGDTVTFFPIIIFFRKEWNYFLKNIMMGKKVYSCQIANSKIN